MLSKVVNKKLPKWRFKFFTENDAFEKGLIFFSKITKLNDIHVRIKIPYYCKKVDYMSMRNGLHE